MYLRRTWQNRKFHFEDKPPRTINRELKHLPDPVELRPSQFSLRAASKGD